MQIFVKIQVIEGSAGQVYHSPGMVNSNKIKKAWSIQFDQVRQSNEIKLKQKLLDSHT